MADQPPARPAMPPADLAALGAWVDELIQELAAHPDPTVGERAFALLDGVDALHRAALGRLVALLAASDGAAVWARARQDPVIRAVLLLYDLVPQGEAGAAAAAASETPSSHPPRPTTALPARHEPAPVPDKRALPMIAPGAAAAIPSPQWRDVVSLHDLPPGMLRGFRVDGLAVLLCNAGSDIVAYEDACPDTPLALSLGQLDGDEIVCPWHGCRFEARSGQRTIHRGTGLRAVPLTVDGSMIRVAVNVSDAPAVGAQAIVISNRSRVAD